MLDCTCQLFPLITSFNLHTTPGGSCVTEGKLRLGGIFRLIGEWRVRVRMRVDAIWTTRDPIWMGCAL